MTTIPALAATTIREEPDAARQRGQARSRNGALAARQNGSDNRGIRQPRATPGKMPERKIDHQQYKGAFLGGPASGSSLGDALPTLLT